MTLRSREGVAAASLRGDVREPRALALRLRYRPPYDWAAMLAHLRARAIDSVEEVTGEDYRRTVSHDGLLGTVLVRHQPERNNLVVTLRVPGLRAREAILHRVRRVFDVGADMKTIGTHLSRDPVLRRLVALRPGLRVPGGWDGFELAVRAVLGQQISVAAARRLAGGLVALCGEALPSRSRSSSGLSHTFPSAARVAAADLEALGMPGARRATLKALAKAAVADPDLFRASGTLEEATSRLRAIRGVGEWTAQYIALRALREADAFPATDVGLLRGAANRAGHRPTPSELLRRADAWRPWRAYAAQHLWAAGAAATPGPSPRPHRPTGKDAR